MEHVWTLLCREAIIDSTTNNITLVNILDQIQVHLIELGREEPKGSLPISME